MPDLTRESKEMDVVISQMIKQKVLLIAANSASFLSNMFLVPKRRRKEPSNTQSQGSQQVHNYGTLQFNKCFSGARVSSERRMAVQVDLAQAYFYLPVAEGHRYVLRLVYRRRLLQITCLPFGLSTAPKTFATVTNLGGSNFENSRVTYNCVSRFSGGSPRYICLLWDHLHHVLDGK